jgi:hypothetical protein
MQWSDRFCSCSQVHLKGRLMLQCSTAPSRFAHVLLTPSETQRRWLLVARVGPTDQVPHVKVMKSVPDTRRHSLVHATFSH